ncbi:MAG: endonuclease domain-containing protein [Solirubrobacteraceae bacterium]
MSKAYLIRELPRAYAVGHCAKSDEADLTSALLYAGPGAMLDKLTAGWWIGIVPHRPARITVSTPRRCRSIPEVAVHGRRPYERLWLPRNGRVWGPEARTAKLMPITPITRLMLDLALILELNPLRKSLAQVEYKRLVTLNTLRDACGQGQPGSVPLLTAIGRHEPKLAKTKSPGEDRLLFICEDYDVPKPDETNIYIHGIESDAVWHKAKLIVEVDGEGNHGTWSQVKRDRRNDKTLRGFGYTVLRYTPDQLKDDPEQVAAEIAHHLAIRTAMSA